MPHASLHNHIPAWGYVALFLLFTHVMVQSATLTITNGCSHRIWPGLLSNAGTSPPPTSGFVLRSGESRSVTVASAWSGRIWARTHCSSDPTSGKFSCLTGNCGSGKIECAGGGATPPATLAELTLSGSGNRDFYDVSLVDGYNTPIALVPEDGKCPPTSCAADLNLGCPPELRVPGNLACKSACEAFGTAEYCCYGQHGSPQTCKPTTYSAFFKKACPSAYSYAYDDGTSTFTCPAGGNYLITFCPSTSSRIRNNRAKTTLLPPTNDTMVYLGSEFINFAPPTMMGWWLSAVIVTFLGWKLVEESWLYL